ncbi:hypothetical protein NC99_37670 [Sunxiuqinia dokdonensis]|uniref:Uncharacterized protein n=1 Tax=Sunxiuqinia dokdonensis TaxID=1409788 RepID=A0A0L8V4Q9_9BACT|nr:hypothetical protein NC99_37670 [Sunxiuqinia dokdonensis]
MYVTGLGDGDGGHQHKAHGEAGKNQTKTPTSGTAREFERKVVLLHKYKI